MKDRKFTIKIGGFALLILAIIGIGSYFWFISPSLITIPKKSSSTIVSSLQKTKEIDKFYTGVYYIPVMDFEMGYLKRDMLGKAAKAPGVGTTLGAILGGIPGAAAGAYLDKKNYDSAKDNPIKEKIKGVCFKKYEVSFGYDHLMNLIENSELIDSICAKDVSKIPNPEILAVNCKSTVTNGKYDSTGVCYSWDSDENIRKNIIKQVMNEDGVLEKVNQRGKESLNNFLSAFCNK